MGVKSMINNFNGEYRWLSNFYACLICYEGDYYTSSEHAYQASKTVIYEERQLFLVSSITSRQAKRMGKKVTLRDDWQEVKLNNMYIINKDKYTRNENLGLWLAETKDEKLVEGNTWNDTFWGVCQGIGDNHLGKTLMRIRKELNQ